LTRAEILDAALDLADQEGLAAVTMRGVAQRLRVTPMALYRHVGDKDGLFDGLLERLMQEVDVQTEQPSWEAALTARAAAMRQAARRHPAAFGLLLARRAVTPEATRARDQVYRALSDAGVPDDDVPRLERLLSTFVIGFAASEANGRFADRERADADFDYALRMLGSLVTTAIRAARDGVGAG
jgi:AcrR family transcriptional regulator